MREISVAEFKALTAKKSKRHKFNVSPKEKRTADGIVFASKLEKTAHEIIRDEFPGIPHATQCTFVLQPGYVDEDGKKVREIRMIPDLLLGVTEAPAENGPIPEHVWVCDHKGLPTPEWKMKAKMFGYKFGKKIRCLRNGKEIREVLHKYEQYRKSLNC